MHPKILFNKRHLQEVTEQVPAAGTLRKNANHFKMMSWADRTSENSAAKNKLEMYRQFKNRGCHYVDIDDGKGGVSSNRRSQMEKVQAGDVVHMYSGHVGEPKSFHFYGIVETTYQNVPDHLQISQIPDLAKNLSDAGRKRRKLYMCSIRFSDSEVLTQEWRDILTQSGCGTIIPLKL